MTRGAVPATTVSIPLRFVKIASKLIPARTLVALREEGIDVGELVRLSEDPEARGEVMVVEAV